MSDTPQTRKQADLLEAGKALFWKYGIRKVTVEDICREAGISRMTFYKYYPNKIDLAVQIIRQLFEKYALQYEQLFAADVSFDEKLKGLIQGKLEASDQMSMEIVREIYQSEIPELVQLLQEMLEKSSRLTVDFIEQGKKEGYIRKDFSNDFILFQLNAILNMMQSDQLLAMFDQPHTLTLHIIDFFFYGIMEHQRS